MLFVWSTSAVQSSGSMALYSSPSIPGKERTTAGFPSVTEVGSAVANLSEISLRLDAYLSIGM